MAKHAPRLALLHSFGPKLAAFGLFAVLLLGVACGGGSDSGSISNSEATDAANNFLKTTLGLFTGTTDPQAFIDQYAPECRQGVDASSLALVSAFMQGIAPEIAGVNIEAVDVGALKVEKTSDGVLVSPEDPTALRVKVDGAFVAASDFFGQAGFVSSEDSSLASPLHLVRRDGKVYLGDCSELKDLSGGPQKVE